MTIPLSLGPIHHLRLTVTDVEQSRAFYMDTRPPVDDPTTT
jgi:hypothetical protein